MNTLTLQTASRSSVDAYLVLGGSIRREIYIAEVAKQQPDIPILISSGSPDPCIWLLFERISAPIHNVWIESCADSTFDNFFFGTSILKRWNVHKVKLVTSKTHLPRAMWLAQLLLGAHGIWVEPEIVPEQGVPGNQESWLKTGLDVSRGVAWAFLGQFYQPRCSQFRALSSVDMEYWEQEGFQCEHQGNLKV